MCTEIKKRLRRMPVLVLQYVKRIIYFKNPKFYNVEFMKLYLVHGGMRRKKKRGKKVLISRVKYVSSLRTKSQE